MGKTNSQSDLFTLEQEGDESRLQEISAEYFKYIDEIFDVLKNDKGRADVTLTETRINPVMLKINIRIDNMITDQKREINKGNSLLISKIETILTYIIAILIISLLFGFISTWFTCKQINSVVIEVNNILRNILQGSFSLHMNRGRAGDIGRLAATVNQFSEKLEFIIAKIKSSVAELHRTSNNRVSIAQKQRTILHFKIERLS